MKSPSGESSLLEALAATLNWIGPAGGGGTVRNMDVDRAGNLWLAESGVGRIARVTISSR